MQLGTVMSTAVSGLERADAQLSRAAEETAAATVPTDRVSLSSSDDLVTAQTDRITAELGYRANLKTLQSAEQMNDVLLQLLSR